MGEKQMNVLTEEMVASALERFAEKLMSQQVQARDYMSFQEFKEKVADWSESTLIRRIKNEEFPAVKDGKGYLIPRDECKAWFKKRTYRGE